MAQKLSEELLENFICHITEKRWREVFLLTAEMSSNADHLLLLMKLTIDRVVSKNEKVQEFLSWLSKKSNSIIFHYKPEALRAFYMYRAFICNPYQWISFKKVDDLYLDHYLLKCINLLTLNNSETAISEAMDDAIDYEIYLERKLDDKLSSNMPFTFTTEINLNSLRYLDKLIGDLESSKTLIEHDFEETLKESIDISRKLELKELEKALENIFNFNEIDRLSELRSLTIFYRNIGHDWQFSQQQKELLKQYNNANNLLIDCLNSNPDVSQKVRQEIEDTLLLPIAEIEKRKLSST